MTRPYVPSRAAVLVPFYKQSITASEEFSFNNTLSVLSKHDIYVICPKRLSGYFSALNKEKISNFKVEYFPDHFFSGICGYNDLLMSVDFYRRFDCYEYMLVVQTDALVFSDQLEEWCDRNYSYVGAPWFRGLTRPTRPLTFLGVGNGGFSLRKVHDCMMILSSPEYLPPVSGKVPLRFCEILRLNRFVMHCLKFSFSYPPIRLSVNEDIFWGVVVPNRCALFSVPTSEDAISFSFEVLPEYLFELNGGRLPFGCHAWEKYNLQFWRNILGRMGRDLP
jgi:hypothetical protein